MAGMARSGMRRRALKGVKGVSSRWPLKAMLLILLSPQQSGSTRTPPSDGFRRLQTVPIYCHQSSSGGPLGTSPKTDPDDKFPSARGILETRCVLLMS